MIGMSLFSKTGLLAFILAASCYLAAAQEFILPLGNNPMLQDQQDKNSKKRLASVLLELPLTDDFSGNSPYPDPNIWSDNLAFINNGFAIDPPSIGVATLDALNAQGAVYPYATISPETFEADLLSSHPVNMNYPASDSIYLSFFYQPQGNGLEPRPYDSLCLDFFDVEDTLWINVWRIPGDTLHPFKQVLIGIKDDRFLKEGFRFRFRNRASLPQNDDYKDKRGNVDHWNIDYVRLDRNRNISDTIIRDVAFSKQIPSILKNYESIPWEHFEIGYNTIYLPYVTMIYFNNDSATRNVTRSLEVYDEVWGESFDPKNSSAQDIFPGTSVSFNNTNIYPFKFNRGDTASYNIKAWLRTDVFDNKSNDTLSRIQVFKDYFAYDDGSAERA